MFEEYQQTKELPASKITFGMLVYFGLGCVFLLIFLVMTNAAYDERGKGHVLSDLLNLFVIAIHLPYILFGGAMIAYTKYIRKTAIKWWLILTLFAAFPFFFAVSASFFPGIFKILFG